MGATGGGGACEDETYKIGNHLKSDNPPGVTGFDFSLFFCFGVVQNFLDLLPRNFDFHNKRFCFDYGCKDKAKKRHFVEVSQSLIIST